MKKIFISFAMMCMAMGGYAATEDDGTYVGWPANYGGVMLQGFWWDSYDATKWTELTSRADELSQYFDLIWVPNSGMTSDYYYNQYNSMGYDPCFWLDHNSCFGTQAELIEMIDAYKAKSVGIIEDVVINHKNGLGSWVNFAQESNVVGPTTGQTYSITWDNTNYSGICSSDECNYNGYPTTGASDTGTDFSAYRDLDHTNTTVQNNIITYLDFLKNELGYAGFRYDMVKGYAPGYIKQYNTAEGIQPEFSVGEYWDNQTNIQNWISNTSYASAAFDFPLKEKLNSAISGGDYSALDWKSFTYDSNYSQYAISFVDNHDTGRSSSEGGSPLVYNWSAANAFILASPGTPCVWFKHYEADPTNIGAMILARKKAGITNTGCTVLQQYATSDNGGYVLETQGTNGKVYVQFGNAVGDTPSGYTLVASGDSYKFYAVYDKPAVIISPNGGTFYTATQDVTLTLNNTATSAWYKIDNGSQVDFTTAQTITLGENVAYGSTITLTWGASDGTTTETGTVTFQKTQAETQSVYLNNVAQWSSVYCYAWNEGGELLGSWPGTQVTTTTTPDGYYQQDFLGEYPTYVIWNTGLGGEQTADLTYTAGTTYTNGESSETNTIYLTNTLGWSTIYCYAWNADGALLGSWPGTAISTMNSDGNFVAEIEGTPTYVIWNNGNGVQTDDLTFVNGTVYDNDGQVIYLNNVAGWSAVNCHYYNESGLSSTWPGKEAKKIDDNNYCVWLAKDLNPTKVIWNNNNNGSKTGEFTFVDGALYNNGSNATINSVEFASDVNNWTASSFNFAGNSSWTYTLDLSNNTADVLFKVIVNDSWLGYDNVTISAPDGWITSSDDGYGGQNIKLNNSTAGYKIYQITATWSASSNATSGWTIAVSGVDTWTIAGESALAGTFWDATDTSNDMTSSDGTNYILTKSNVLLTPGTYEFKVVRNHNWSSGSYGMDCANDNNQTLTISETGVYNVTFSFNSSSHALSAIATKIECDYYYIDNVASAITSTCEVILSDGTSSSFSSDVASFTAANASYSRSSSYQWGTLCLPFEIKNTYDGVTFYQLSGVDLDNNVLNFDPVSGTISSGTPIVYKVSTADSEGKYNLSISESSVTVVNAPVTGAAVDGWTLEGTFSRLTGLTATTDDGNKQYYIAKNKFWNEDFNVSAYRGWFIATEAAASNAPFRISGGDADGIQYVEQEDGSVKVYYDLQGRKTNADRKGLVIENGKVIFVK